MRYHVMLLASWFLDHFLVVHQYLPFGKLINEVSLNSLISIIEGIHFVLEWFQHRWIISQLRVEMDNSHSIAEHYAATRCFLMWQLTKNGKRITRTHSTINKIVLLREVLLFWAVENEWKQSGVVVGWRFNKKSLWANLVANKESKVRSVCQHRL